MSIGVPVKLLHEAEGHTVTIELKTGELYRGKLIEAEDNMNCQVCAGTDYDRVVPFRFISLCVPVLLIRTSRPVERHPLFDTSIA